MKGKKIGLATGLLLFGSFAISSVGYGETDQKQGQATVELLPSKTDQQVQKPGISNNDGKGNQTNQNDPKTGSQSKDPPNKAGQSAVTNKVGADPKVPSKGVNVNSSPATTSDESGKYPSTEGKADSLLQKAAGLLPQMNDQNSFWLSFSGSLLMILLLLLLWWKRKRREEDET